MRHNTTPFDDHLQVRILDFKQSVVEDWKDSYLSYKLANVNGVAVIGYFFSHENLNCIAHINYPDLLEWGSPQWLESQDQLKIFVCLYDLPNDLILDMKSIVLSKLHTALVRDLCYKTQHWPKRIIDSIVSFVYEVKFEEIFE